jgi:hypothetical protein
VRVNLRLKSDRQRLKLPTEIDAMTKRISKRIEQVTLKRMTDDSPDTSYLGEYSDRAKTDYAIDRAHADDCPSLEHNHADTVEALEHVLQYLDSQRTTEGDNPDSIYWEPLDDAIGLIADTQSEAQECTCSGGDMERGEYRYFNGCVENYKGESPADIRQHIRQDYERMESLHRGDWVYIGLRAEAQVVVDGMVQEITSGGLWGIESDSGREYLAEVETEELASLRQQLRALGFGTRAISTAFKNVEHAD